MNIINKKAGIPLKITFTSAAIEKLKPILSATDKQLKFFHDTEGCGCGMSGIPDPLPFYYAPRHKVFYEEHLTVDFNSSSYSYRLKSDSQIYTTNLRVIP